MVVQPAAHLFHICSQTAISWPTCSKGACQTRVTWAGRNWRLPSFKRGLTALTPHFTIICPKNIVVSSSWFVVKSWKARASIQLQTVFGQPAAHPMWCLMCTVPSSSPTSNQKRWQRPRAFSMTNGGAKQSVTLISVVLSEKGSARGCASTNPLCGNHCLTMLTTKAAQ